MYEIICNLAREVSLPHLNKLDRYLKKNSNVGIEKWFQVELVDKLLKTHYAVTVSHTVPVNGHNRRPDLKIEHGNKSFLLELKAGELWGYISEIKKDADKFPNCEYFLGCLFLGRFTQSKDIIKEKLENGGRYRCLALELVRELQPQW